MSRYYTFKRILEHLADQSAPVVVELGTSRSFRTGYVEQDPARWDEADPSTWDHGAGVFTRVVAECMAAAGRSFALHTVDVDAGALQVCERIVAGLPGVRPHLASSTDFLCRLESKADVIYMDQAETSEEAARLHLEDARLIVERDLIQPGGYVLIDDVGCDLSGGKGRYSMPFLLENGFTLEMAGYQALLKKSI